MSTRLANDASRAVLVPAVRDLARRLLAQGASPAFAQRVVVRVEALARREALARGEALAGSDAHARSEAHGRDAAHSHPLDLAARVIGSSFPRVVLRTPRAGPALVSVFGPPGSGRSSFVRKLALRLRGAQRRVAVLAVRQRGSSKPEWLATWLSEIGALAQVVDAGTGAVPSIFARADVVLLDGCGELQRDTALAEKLARRGPLGRSDGTRLDGTLSGWTRIGVLAGDAAPEQLRADAHALRTIGADCSVLTRLDLARTPAAAFEIASAANLPVAFVSAGKVEADHLYRCGPERAANVFLKGRIA